MVLRNCAGLLTVYGVWQWLYDIAMFKPGHLLLYGTPPSKHLTSEDTWIWTLISETIVVQMWIPT